MGFWIGAIRGDGLIYGVDYSVVEPDDAAEAIMLANAERALGRSDWEATIFTEEQAQFILGNLPGRCWYIDGEIVAREAPTITLSAVVIDTLRSEGITADIDVHATDTNNVDIRVSYPSGRLSVETLVLDQGLASLELHTAEIGTHTLEVTSIETGTARVEFEGRELKPIPRVQAQIDRYKPGLFVKRPYSTILDRRMKTPWQIP